MRWLVPLAVLVLAAPAAAASLLVMAHDARLSAVFAHAMQIEGADVVAIRSVAPRTGGAELAERLREAVRADEPELVVVVGAPDEHDTVKIVVAAASGELVGTLFAQKRALTSPARARAVARRLLGGIESKTAATRAEQRERLTLARVYSPFAVPANAPFVNSP